MSRKVRLCAIIVFIIALRQHRTIASAGFDGSFTPQIRCETLKYTKYSSAFATNL